MHVPGETKIVEVPGPTQIVWLPGYVGLFSCTSYLWVRRQGSWRSVHTLCLIARLCRAFFMHEGSADEYTTAEMFRMLCESPLIARLCRAFFMHEGSADEYTTAGMCRMLCESCLIARLCRAFFMHNCINFGINNGVNKNHLIFVLLMSVFYYSSFSFTFE